MIEEWQRALGLEGAPGSPPAAGFSVEPYEVLKQSGSLWAIRGLPLLAAAAELHEQHRTFNSFVERLHDTYYFLQIDQFNAPAAAAQIEEARGNIRATLIGVLDRVQKAHAELDKELGKLPTH